MEKMKGMEGFFTACVTPYDAQGEVNPQALTQLMSRNLDDGAAGFLVGAAGKRRCSRKRRRSGCSRRLQPIQGAPK